jgi:hypothetical protein
MSIVKLCGGKLIGVGTIIAKNQFDGKWSAGSYTVSLEPPPSALRAAGAEGTTQWYDATHQHYECLEVFCVNEFLAVRGIRPLTHDSQSSASSHSVLATTPDLIVCVDVDSGANIFVDEMQHNLRLALLHLPCAACWREGEALQRASPKSELFPLPDCCHVDPVLLPNPMSAPISVCQEFRSQPNHAESN